MLSKMFSKDQIIYIFYFRDKPDRNISPVSRNTSDTDIDNHIAKKKDSKNNSRPNTDKSIPLKRKSGNKTESESGRTTGSSYVPKPKYKKSKKGSGQKSKPMYSRDKKAHELGNMTPRKEKSTVSQVGKPRPTSLNLETERSIYRSSTHLWDNDKKELTYHPATNTEADVLVTYTGEHNMREALKSARGKRTKDDFEDVKGFTVFKTGPKNPPWYEKEYVLNKRQAGIYQNMKSAYTTNNGNKAREKQFMKKLRTFQEEVSKMELEKMREKEMKIREEKRRQVYQLKELRQRFEDEAWHRFHTQYVTSRVLEHEKMNRFEYGLPEEPSGKPEFASKLKRKPKKPLINMSKKELDKLNKDKFAVMFKKNVGPVWSKEDKDPKMEGIDTVVLRVDDKEGMVFLFLFIFLTFHFNMVFGYIGMCIK